MSNLTDNDDFQKFVNKRKLLGFLIVGAMLLFFVVFILMMIFFPVLIADNTIGNISVGIIYLFTLIAFSILISLYYYRCANVYDVEQEKFKQLYFLQLELNEETDQQDVKS